MSVPQLETHPFLRADVPGFPMGEDFFVQKSPVIPHWPQTLQQAFRGQAFRLVSSVSSPT